MAPPVKKAKKEPNSNSISMVVKKWKKGENEQFSAVHRINGYPFRIRLWKLPRLRQYADLECDKSTESDLWKCAATLSDNGLEEKYTFCSWREDPRCRRGISVAAAAGSTLTVTVTVDDDGDRWRLRPTLESIDPPKTILLIGEAKKKISVNKEFLASQSPFFDRLFFGDFAEKNMHEIPIGGVEFEEFSYVIKLVCGSNEASVTNENAVNVLELADRFEIKIVEDRVVSFVLSKKCSFSLAKKLLMAHNYNIPFLMKRDPEYAFFPDALKVEIFNHMMN